MKNCTKVKYLLFVCLICSSAVSAQTWKWAKGSSCPKGAIESWAIAVDHAGNVYEAGEPVPLWIPTDSVKCYFESNIVKQPNGMVLYSTDSNGNFRWELSPSNGYCYISNICTDANNNLYLFGFFTHTLTLGTVTVGGSLQTAFCSKISSSGTVIWIQSLGDSAFCKGGAVDKNGNVYVSGDFQAAHITIGSTTINNSTAGGVNYDIFVAKLDSFGNIIWADGFGGGADENVSGVAATDNGDVSVAGKYNSGSFHLGASTLTYPGPGPSSYLFLTRLDSSGDVVWADQAVPTSGYYLNNVAVDIWGNTYLVGTDMYGMNFGGYVLPPLPGFRIFVAKYDNGGNVKWAITDSTRNVIQAYAVAPDACGNVWVFGQGLPADSPANSDATFIYEYDGSGVLKDTMFLTCGGDDQCGIVVDNKGNFYIGGDYTHDNFVIGSDTLHLKDSTTETLFMAKYAYPFCNATPLFSAPLFTASNEKITLYPNPATNECTIVVNNNSDRIKEIRLYDLMGRNVLQETFGNRTATFSVSKLLPGVYTCRILTNDYETFLKKIVVEK